MGKLSQGHTATVAESRQELTPPDSQASALSPLYPKGGITLPASTPLCQNPPDTTPSPGHPDECPLFPWNPFLSLTNML